jgi:hypothetical protein
VEVVVEFSEQHSVIYLQVIDMFVDKIIHLPYFVDLTAMFAPRGMLQFRKPVEERKLPPYTGIAQYTNLFETVPPPPPQPVETPLQRKIHMKEKLQATNAEKNELLAGNWDPHNNPKATE